MKRIKILFLLFFLATGLTVNAESSHNNNQQHSNNDHRGQKPVGAPLDGGLLTVLGVAGVGYYAARKKGKKPES